MFKAGDIVQLKSGGPKMTVTKVEGNEVLCVWFDGQHQEKNSIFQLATVELYKSPASQSQARSYRPGEDF